MGQSKSVRLAAVQYSPAFLDLKGSIDKSVSLILEAGRNSADIVGFPEGFIPTHPLWYHFHPASSPEARLSQNGLLRTASLFPDRMLTHCAKLPGMPAFSL